MESGIFLIIIFLAVGGYLLPTLVATSRGTKSFWGVLILNIFLGWTLLGWLIAFVWAFGRTQRDDRIEANRHAELIATLQGPQGPPPKTSRFWGPVK